MFVVMEMCGVEKMEEERSLQQIVINYIAKNSKLIKTMCYNYISYSKQPLDVNLLLPILE